MFIKNCWYVAAWSHEVGADNLLARTITGVPLVFWRKSDGGVVAFEDRCCHRGAPLSLGRREGDSLRCMYHGMRFDGSGCCVEIPSQENIPPGSAVKTHPVVERNRWLWVWMGEPAQADPGQVPDVHWLGDPAWVGVPGYLHYDVNYLLIADNLLDFSHLSFVHEKTLGGSIRYAHMRPKVSRIDNGIRVERWLLDDDPAPFLKNVKTWPGKVDRWNIYDFLLPGVLVMDSGSAPAGSGAPEGKRVDAAEFRSCQAITPETEETSHYFFSQLRNFATGDEAITAALHASILAGFEEDRTMISGQAKVLKLDPGFKMQAFAMDAALGQFRWLVDQRLRAEAAVTAEASAAMPKP